MIFSKDLGISRRLKTGLAGLVVLGFFAACSERPKVAPPSSKGGKGGAGADGPSAGVTPGDVDACLEGMDLSGLRLAGNEGHKKIDGSRLKIDRMDAVVLTSEGQRILSLFVEPKDPPEKRPEFYADYAEFRVCDEKSVCIGGQDDRENGKLPQWNTMVPLVDSKTGKPLGTTIFVSVRACADEIRLSNANKACGPWHPSGKSPEVLKAKELNFPQMERLLKAMRDNEVKRASLVKFLVPYAREFIRMRGGKSIPKSEEALLAAAYNVVDNPSLFAGAFATDALDRMAEEIKEVQASAAGGVASEGLNLAENPACNKIIGGEPGNPSTSPPEVTTKTDTSLVTVTATDTATAAVDVDTETAIDLIPTGTGGEINRSSVTGSLESGLKSMLLAFHYNGKGYCLYRHKSSKELRLHPSACFNDAFYSSSTYNPDASKTEMSNSGDAKARKWWMTSQDLGSGEKTMRLSALGDYDDADSLCVTKEIVRVDGGDDYEHLTAEQSCSSYSNQTIDDDEQVGIKIVALSPDSDGVPQYALTLVDKDGNDVKQDGATDSQTCLAVDIETAGNNIKIPSGRLAVEACTTKNASERHRVQISYRGVASESEPARVDSSMVNTFFKLSRGGECLYTNSVLEGGANSTEYQKVLLSPLACFKDKTKDGQDTYPHPYFSGFSSGDDADGRLWSVYREKYNGVEQLTLRTGAAGSEKCLSERIDGNISSIVAVLCTNVSHDKEIYFKFVVGSDGDQTQNKLQLLTSAGDAVMVNNLKQCLDKAEDGSLTKKNCSDTGVMDNRFKVSTEGEEIDGKSLITSVYMEFPYQNNRCAYFDPSSGKLRGHAEACLKEEVLKKDSNLLDGTIKNNPEQVKWNLDQREIDNGKTLVTLRVGAEKKCLFKDGDHGALKTGSCDDKGRLQFVRLPVGDGFALQQADADGEPVPDMCLQLHETSNDKNKDMEAMLYLKSCGDYSTSSKVILYAAGKDIEGVGNVFGSEASDAIGIALAVSAFIGVVGLAAYKISKMKIRRSGSASDWEGKLKGLGKDGLEKRYGIILAEDPSEIKVKKVSSWGNWSRKYVIVADGKIVATGITESELRKGVGKGKGFNNEGERVKKQGTGVELSSKANFEFLKDSKFAGSADSKRGKTAGKALMGIGGAMSVIAGGMLAFSVLGGLAEGTGSPAQNFAQAMNKIQDNLDKLKAQYAKLVTQRDVLAEQWTKRQSQK